MFGTILLFLVLLSLLVFVHEAGHFFMAKKMKMKVEEFGFGFPPRAWGIKKGDTVYSVNWIPLGGFVKIKGESGENAHDPDSFASKKAWQRFLVLVAGVAMNFALAAVLLSIGFLFGLPSVVDENLPAYANVRDERVVIMAVSPDSPASRAGIEAGDSLLSIDGQTFVAAEAARAYIAEHGDRGIDVVVKKTDGTTETVEVTSEDLAGTDVHGIGVGILSTGLVSFPVHMAVVHGVSATWTYTVEVVKAFGGLIGNLVVKQEVSVDLSGPVGIAVMTGEVAAMGFSYLLQFAALLSINLAVLNILPFPALDGGRVLFLIIEKLRRKPVDVRVEAAVHNLGFALLMILVVLVTYRDFVKFGDQIWGTLRSLVGA